MSRHNFVSRRSNTPTDGSDLFRMDYRTSNEKRQENGRFELETAAAKAKSTQHSGYHSDTG